jgi:hypothetical protein
MKAFMFAALVVVVFVSPLAAQPLNPDDGGGSSGGGSCKWCDGAPDAGYTCDMLLPCNSNTGCYATGGTTCATHNVHWPEQGPNVAGKSPHARYVAYRRELERRGFTFRLADGVLIPPTYNRKDRPALVAALAVR